MPEEQALFNSSHGTSIVCLTRGDSIGLTLVAESGFISLIAVLGVFVLIFVSLAMHQQNYKKLSALLGLSAAFPVANKSQQVHPTTNLEIVKTYDSPRLIYDFPISLRHKLSKITSPHLF